MWGLLYIYAPGVLVKCVQVFKAQREIAIWDWVKVGYFFFLDYVRGALWSFKRGHLASEANVFFERFVEQRNFPDAPGNSCFIFECTLTQLIIRPMLLLLAEMDGAPQAAGRAGVHVCLGSYHYVYIDVGQTILRQGIHTR